jgi:hypothetical protein
MHLNMWLVRPKEGRLFLPLTDCPLTNPCHCRRGKRQSPVYAKAERLSRTRWLCASPGIFYQGDITPAAWEQVQKELSRLRAGKPAALP